MNRKLEEFKKTIKTKKVAVLGIGVSNIPLINYLSDLGVDITAFDKSSKEILGSTAEEFLNKGVALSLGENYLDKLKGFDVVFRTPGIRFDIPELTAEKERGAEITSEMEVFFELCPAEIFAVTGSDGKTTTTTLIYNILKQEGYSCWLGGNIGTPLLSRIDEIKETDKVVLELSSFQLHTMRKSPEHALITNITPNHLDVHKSLEEYIDAKKNIFIHQKDEKGFGTPRLVLNLDNEITKGLAREAKGKVVFFSRKQQLMEGAFLKDGVLVYKKDNIETEIVKADDIVIPGMHNIENYLAATAMTMNFVKPETIHKVAGTFKGVEHRIELVREINGVRFYNSSIDSSPSRTAAALSTFKQKVILIAGGKDKGIPYDEIGEPIAQKVKCLVLIGATAPKIEQALKDTIEKTGKGKDIPVFKCSTYEEAVKTAYENAKPGDIVILSPASTSFDMFKNFEERGRVFKDIVNSLATLEC
ncbi:MAG: UDP-N-acetylmuramoyl-L-alanine--D-glutamate ligase [Clostridia bacterium]|nr:UDP-N-acetylmuramoyl-L-alanine--D-glutamate ligase [Clostridia bacterium]